MERRKFTREFKLEAVRLIRDRGVSYSQASQDLNYTSQLRDWVKKLSDDPQHGDLAQARKRILEGLQPLGRKLGCKFSDTGNVTARAGQAIDQNPSQPDRHL